MSTPTQREDLEMVRQLFKVRDLHPSMLDPVLRHEQFDKAVLYHPDQDYYHLLGHPVRLDDSITVITVEWPGAA